MDEIKAEQNREREDTPAEVQTTSGNDVRQQERKKCLSCGADQKDDGSLLCGH